jgi:hypothetical protein
MRAKEFILEYKLSVSKDADGVAIKATAGGKNLGHAEFFFDEAGRLDPQTVWVDERYYGQGIARDMYDQLKSMGYTIIRSWDQTDAGKGFWNKHRGKDATVWEDDLNEFAPSPDRDNNDDVPDPIFVLANRWWNAAEKQPQIEHVLNSLGWSIQQVESEDDAVQLQHRNGTSYFISADDFDPDVFENFADGKVKGKSRPGRVKRAGASCSGSVTDLRAKAKKYGGEKGKMYHWCANMKSGRKKNK